MKFLMPILAAVAIVACQKDRPSGDPAGTTTLTSGELSVVRTDDARPLLANARCGRQAACGNIGRGRLYSTHEACLAELGGEEALTDAQCSRGVATKALQACLHVLETERCDDVIGDVTRLALCDRGSLCVK